MSRELNRAFEKRQLGDYEYTFVFSQEESRTMLENGKAFVENAAAYLTQEGFLPKD